MITVEHVKKTDYDTVTALKESWQHWEEITKYPDLFHSGIITAGLKNCPCCRLYFDTKERDTFCRLCPLGDISTRCCGGLHSQFCDQRGSSSDPRRAQRIADYIYDIYLQALEQEGLLR